MVTQEDTSAPPSRRDPVVAAASQVIGGPVGRYAAWARGTARLAWAPVASVLLGLASLVMAAAVLQKAHCVLVGWKTPDQFWHACYSDLPVVYQSAGLAGGSLPYVSSGGPRLDQPLISGLAMWLVSLVVPDGTSPSEQKWYFALWAVLLTVVLLALVFATVRSCRRSPWNAAHVAVSPVLVTAALVSVDLLGVLLASLALWAWGRNRVILAGVLFGLAVATRTYPLVLVAAIGLLALRSGRVRAWGRMAGTGLATWLVVIMPWLLVSPGGSGGVLSAYGSWRDAGAGYGSPWLLPSLLEAKGGWPHFRADHPEGAPRWVTWLAGALSSAPPTTVLAMAGWGLALVVGAVFALSLDRRPTVAEVGLVMLAIVMLTGKVLPVQSALWLLPLVALVGMSWRDHLIWAGLEVAYFVGVWLYIAGLSTPDRGLPPGGYALLLMGRLGAVLYLVVQVWRRAATRRLVYAAEPAEAAEAAASAEQADGAGEGTEGAGEWTGESAEGAERVGVDRLAQPDEIDDLAGPMAGAPDRLLVRFG